MISLIKSNSTYGQKVFTLKDAIAEGIKNYGIIKAKIKYAEASKIAVKQAKRENIPNFNLSAQQDYGTVNGQFGPLFGFGGLGLASSGPAFDKQYSNAAFGAAYLANINWEFFAFGKARRKVKVAEAIAVKDYKDGINDGVLCYNPGLGPDLSNYTGTVSLEGPHYPKAHTWYASGVMKDGILVKVK